MQRWLVALLMISVTWAGCLGDDEPEPIPEPTPRPALGGVEDATLSQTGRWLEPFDGEIAAVSMALLHDGRILYYSGVDAFTDDTATDIIAINQIINVSESRILDLNGDAPVITSPGRPDGSAGDLFCGGLAILPDGKVIALGGTEWGVVPDPNQANMVRGLQDTRIFDPESNNWTTASTMLLRRWYPTGLLTEDGRVMAVGGIDHWEMPTDHWASWEQRTGDSWDGVDGTTQVLPLYPHVYLVPGGPYKGQYFADTTGALWAPFGEHPEQPLWSLQWTFDPATAEWTSLGPSQYGARSYAGHAMLQLDPDNDYAPSFLMVGGSLYQTAIGTPFAELTDLSTDPPTQITVPDMDIPRWHPFSILLPDGDVFVLGGGQYDNVLLLGGPTFDEIHETRIYDPDTNGWRNTAPMQVERVYHSTMALLPDGRILAGGHVPDPMILQPWREVVWDQIVETRFEIYEPGYLFRGARPIIVDAPDNGTYGETITLDVELPADLDSVILVRPTAITHTFDANMRHVRLPVLDQDGTNVTVALPPDGFVAPPGHYMVFALSEHAEGPVPSEAAWIHLS